MNLRAARRDHAKRMQDAGPGANLGIGLARCALAALAARWKVGATVAEIAKDLGFDAEADAIDRRQSAARVEKDASEQTVSAGGAWIPELFSREFIRALAQLPTIRSLVPPSSILEMSSETMTVPKNSTLPTSYFLTENQQATKSDPGFGSVSLNTKKMATECVVSRNLLSDCVNADQYIRAIMLRSASVREDLSFLIGALGGEMKGVVSQVPSGNQIAANATVNFTNCVADLNKIVSKLEDASVPLMNGGFVMHPRSKSLLWTSATGAGTVPFEEEMHDGNDAADGSWSDDISDLLSRRGTLLGYQWRKTTQLPTPGAGGRVLFGDWSEFIIGERIAMEIDVDSTYISGGTTQAALARDQVVLRLWRRIDCAVRHPESFAMLTGVTWTA